MNKICQSTLWTPIICSLTLVMFDNTGKKGQFLLFTGNFDFIFKNLCFQQPYRSYENAPRNYTTMVTKNCGLLKNVPWGLSHSIILGRMGQKLLSLWKQLFTETFVPTDQLCPKKMISSFARYMSKYLEDPYEKICLTFVMFDNTGKIGQNLFFTGKFAFLFLKFVFSTNS